MPDETDQQIKARLAKLSHQEVARIYLYAPDPENLTREEWLALQRCERENIDF